MGQIANQIHAQVADKVGRLAELTDKLTGAGVNLLAAVAWAEGGRGHIVMVPDDCDKACDVIKDFVDECKCEEVVHVSLANEIGALGAVAHKLADAGIGIHMMYATAAGDKALIVLMTSDNAKASSLI